MVPWKSPGFGEVKQKQGSWDSNLMALSLLAGLEVDFPLLGRGRLGKCKIFPFCNWWNYMILFIDCSEPRHYQHAEQTCSLLQSFTLLFENAHTILAIYYYYFGDILWMPDSRCGTMRERRGAAGEEEVRSQQESWSFCGVQPRMVLRGGEGLTIPLNFWGTLQSPGSSKRAVIPLSERRRPLVAGPGSRSPLPRTRRKARSGRGRRSPQAAPVPQGLSAKTYRDSRAVSSRSRRYNSRRPGAGRYR